MPAVPFVMSCVLLASAIALGAAGWIYDEPMLAVLSLGAMLASALHMCAAALYYLCAVLYWKHFRIFTKNAESPESFDEKNYRPAVSCDPTGKPYPEKESETHA